jgi:hypothetical protein
MTIRLSIDHFEGDRKRIGSEDYILNALGKEAGVSTSVLSRYLAGERDIRAETAQKRCKALDLVLVPREMLDEKAP